MVHRALPGVAPGTDPRVSPLLAEDLAGLPAAYVAVAGFDVLRDEGEAYARKMAAAGVPVALRRHDQLTHGFATRQASATRNARRCSRPAALCEWQWGPAPPNGERPTVFTDHPPASPQ